MGQDQYGNLTSGNVTYGRSTYQQLIDAIWSDLNRGGELNGLSAETVQRYILDAEEDLCKRFVIGEEYDLGLNQDVDKYFLRDRPAVTGVSGATPMVVTAVAHGLTTADRIFQTGVTGEAGANGAFYATRLTADTFSIKHVRDITGASNETNIEITTEVEHGRTTGDTVTISGVLGNTAANTTDTITVTGVRSFTMDNTAGNGTYTGGGIVLVNAAPLGTYSAGGRFWRDDELPTWVHKVIRVRRPWGNYFPPIAVSGYNAWLDSERDQSWWGTAVATDWSPAMSIQHTVDQKRFVRFWPAPQEDKTVRVLCSMMIVPRLYMSDGLTSYIHLSAVYDSAIRLYASMRIALWLRDAKMFQLYSTLYEQETHTVGRTTASPGQMRITYR